MTMILLFMAILAVAVFANMSGHGSHPPSQSSQTRQLLVATEDQSLAGNDCPALIVNRGASGTVVVDLPEKPLPGMMVQATVLAAESLRLNPADDAGIYADDGSSYAKQDDGKYLASSTVGESVTLIADDNGDWVAVQQNGFETVEA